MRSSSISASPPSLGSPPNADSPGSPSDPGTTLSRLCASSGSARLNKALFEGQQVYVVPGWLRQQTRHLSTVQKTLIGRALHVLHNGTDEDRNYAAFDRSGDFDLADKSHGADHAVFQHDLQGNLCFLSVRSADRGDDRPAEVLAEIGSEAAPSSTGSSSRSPSPHPLQTGWRASAGSPEPMSDGNNSDGSPMQQSTTQPAAGQKRKRPPASNERLVDGKRPASPSEAGSRRSSIDSKDLDDCYDDLFRDSHSSNSSRAASPAGISADSQEGAASPIEPIQRQSVEPAQRKAFERTRLACMSILVKYFSDSELADLTRTGGTIEFLTQRANACGAPETDIDALRTRRKQWLNDSKTAIADIQEDDPFFFNANGKPMDAGLIQFNRGSRCRNVQPLAIRHSAEVEKANSILQKRFRDAIIKEAGLKLDASTYDISRKNYRYSSQLVAANAFAAWAINNNVNLSQLHRDALNSFRNQYCTRPRSDNSEPSSRIVSERKYRLSHFIDFLFAEYGARTQAAENNSPTGTPPGPHSA